MTGFFFKGIKMQKKLLLTSFSIFLASNVFAGQMGSCPLVNTPCNHHSWSLGIDGIYNYIAFDGQPNFNNFEQSDWSWDIHGSYHFNESSDIKLSYFQYYNTEPYTNLLGTIAFSPLLPAANSNYTLNENIQIDRVNLLMGQQIEAGMLKNLHIYAGAQYADIRYNGDNNFSTVPALLAASGVNSVSQYHNSDFNGIGPVIGADYSYEVGHGFNLTADYNLSLLYGTSRVNEGYVYSDALIVNTVYGSKRSLVPGMQLKLGGSYLYPTNSGSFAIEAGYTSSNYFNALSKSLYSSDNSAINYNFAYYGPYLGINWHA